jgi:Fic family protein
MKIPEKAPDWAGILNAGKLDFAKMTSIEMGDLLRKANKEYLYWDKFKYLNFPVGVSIEDAWSWLKISRLPHMRRIDLLDTQKQSFGYWLPDGILKDLHYIDQHGGGQVLVDYPNIHNEQKERYLINSLMEEAIASSQLEGAVATRKIAKEMLRSGRKPKTHAERMILNNYNTIKNIKDFVNEPLTPGLLNKLQASMTKNTLDDPGASGRFRNSSEPIHIVDNEGHILFNPPPADEIETRVSELCKFANDEKEDVFIHPVIKAILLHFWLAYIHPYVDGNGRTARALFYWYMLKNKYWMFEYLSVSRIILKAPSLYARAYLYSEMDDRDITYFLSFNTRAICLAIEELRLYLTKQQEELKETMKFLKGYSGLNHRQNHIMHHALAHPDAVYTIEYHKNEHGVVYQTARADLIDLEDRGLLEKKQTGKTFYFVPSADIHKKLRSLKK